MTFDEFPIPILIVSKNCLITFYKNNSFDNISTNLTKGLKLNKRIKKKENLFTDIIFDKKFEKLFLAEVDKCLGTII